MTNRMQIIMDDDDFRLLIQNAMQWAGGGWERHIASGRFVNAAGPARPSARWKVAYWFGENYAAVIFAKAFLDDREFRYEVVNDNVDPGGGWMILTDYDMTADRR